MAADCLASYGSLARFKDVQRLHALSQNCLLGVGGDISDMQYTLRMLRQYQRSEVCANDGHHLSPKQWHTALSSVQYRRRSEMNPLWNANVIAGVDKTGEVFLGYSDLIGTTYEDDVVATGFGAYLAIPLLRKAATNAAQLSEDQAVALLEQCLRVLYYRDARSLDLIQIAKVTSHGVVVSAPRQLQSDWSIAG